MSPQECKQAKNQEILFGMVATPVGLKNPYVAAVLFMSGLFTALIVNNNCP